jgi:tetratricopeptide (TPR) repeat protein
MRILLITVRAFLVLLLLAAPRPVFAANYTDTAALDELFGQLKIAKTAEDANDLVAQIWTLWFTPDSPELTSRMAHASAAMTGGDFNGALVMLTAITKDFPDYSEGWNQRATLYYMMGQLDASLADIATTLALEPRHFGALSGRVMIELKQGKRPEALRDMIAALAIDPYLETKKLFPELSQNTTNV